MSMPSENSNLRMEQIPRALIQHQKLWIFPGLVCLALSWFYVYFVREDAFSARQSLIVRDDLLGQSLKPGRFESLDLMKSAQETILEIARKPQVIRKTLQKVGPAKPGIFRVDSAWPDDKIIEEVQESITFSAPNGAEFGHTEVIILSTKSGTRERARNFILALLDEIDVKINEVRQLRLGSMEDELTQIRNFAQDSLATSAAKLRQLEQQVGPDLSTLRGLSDQQAGGGTLGQQLLEIRSEKRQAGGELDSARNQRKMLVAAKDDPSAILATSDELFKFQPTLNQLKRELILAQSNYAGSVGRYKKAHPIVKSNLEEVRSMHGQIHDELDSALRGIDSRIEVLSNKVDKLSGMALGIEEKFNGLSALRVDYLRLDEEVKKKTQVFNDAQGNLASVQRLDANGRRVNLLTRVDQPQVATRADGLGKKTTILAGGLAGLFAGLGLVLLVASTPEQKTDAVENEQAVPVPSEAARRPVASVSAQVTDNSFSGLAPVANTGGPVVAEPLSTTNTRPLVPEPSAKSAIGQAALKPTARPVVSPKTEPMVAPTIRPADTAVEQVSAEVRSQAPSAGSSQKSSMVSALGKLKPSEPAVSSAPVQPRLKQAQAKEVDQVAAAIASKPQANRGSGDSSGVPTAASILAALTQQIRPSAGTGSSSGVKPQISNTSSLSDKQSAAKRADKQAEQAPSIVVAPVDDGSAAKEFAALDVKRRKSSLRPNEIASQAEGSAQSGSPRSAGSVDAIASESGQAIRPLPVTEPRASADTYVVQPPLNLSASCLAPGHSGTDAKHQSQISEPAQAETGSKSQTRAENPFLKRPATGSSPSSSVPAVERLPSEQMVEPVKPCPTAEDKAFATRQPASTVPIPEQIRQLTESVSAFAKPITRTNDPVQKSKVEREKVDSGSSR